MRLEIKYKLLILIVLPVITIIFFSALHIYDKYSQLAGNDKLLSYSKIIKKSSNLIHEIQIERGLSYNSLINDNPYFIAKLQVQKQKTDESIEEFKHYIAQVDPTILSPTTIDFINKINISLSKLRPIREKIIQKDISAKDSFKIYTTLDKNIIELVESFALYSNNTETYEDAIALKNILVLQELAGQERALVSSILQNSNTSSQSIQKFYALIFAQKEKYRSIEHLVINQKIKKTLQEIHEKYKRSFIVSTREYIKRHESKQLILSEIFKIIGYGGMIHDLKRYKKSKNIKFYNSFLQKQKKFNKLIDDYLALTYKNSVEYMVSNKLKENFLAVQKDPQSPFNAEETLKLYKKLSNQTYTIDPKKWFEISTQRINKFHDLEVLILSIIDQNTHNDKVNIINSISFLILLTLVTIFSLLLGARHIYIGIGNSIAKLANGVEEFFNFLNFKRDKALPIDTNSNDEISDIAQGFNKQIQLVQENLEEDKVFINETTQIVTLMKDGIFSERLYFDPHNPNLKELKTVFNELIELISDKIKEQTLELEKLNASLENEVFRQTIELQEKVTELTVARDKAIQAEIAKDEFLANMSHEIRTPLNAILGFVTILKKRVDDEKSLSYLNIIDGSGKSLLTIINDILDFSKIQSGKFTINPHNIDPLEEFSNAVLLFASKAYEKHLNYAVYIDPKLPRTICIDSVRVKQILSNLLSNAIKFTPEDGTIKVKIICENTNLLISIQDTGIGISKKNQSKIFSAFEQADGSTTRKYGGTGLGLSISSKLAKLMNGELTLCSEEHKGSTFTLTLPVEIIDNKPNENMNLRSIADLECAILTNPFTDTSDTTRLIKKYLSDFGLKHITQLDQYQEDGYDILFFIPDDDYNEDIVNSTTPSVAILKSASIKLANLEHIQPLYAPFIPKSIIEAINDLGIKKMQNTSVTLEESNEQEVHYKGNVLVAEDNKTNQMLISLILDDYGIEYKIANNGLEAVELFQNNSFDMVLMDENMPELNGIGAMQKIKEYEKANSLLHTPVIALTASVLESDKEMFINAGMDGFVGKPINNKELEAEFDKYLQKQ